MWKAIFWEPDACALGHLSMVAGDVPSWATTSMGGWREDVLVLLVAVSPHRWVRPVCGEGMGAGEFGGSFVLLLSQ